MKKGCPTGRPFLFWVGGTRSLVVMRWLSTCIRPILVAPRVG